MAQAVQGWRRVWMAAALAALAVAGGAVRAGGEARPLEGVEAERFVFSAVLDGLLEDAVEDAVVGAVLDRDERGGYRHFVYACPSCNPVLEAFRCYDQKKHWLHARKSGAPYRGPGAEAATLPEASGDPEVRKLLGDLVTRYVGRQIERRRLTEDERAVLGRSMEEFRKKGMSTLGSYRANGGTLAPPGMTDCPSCDGAVEGSIPR